MKNVKTLLFVLLLAITLTGCTNKETKNDDTPIPTTGTNGSLLDGDTILDIEVVDEVYSESSVDDGLSQQMITLVLRNPNANYQTGTMALKYTSYNDKDVVLGKFSQGIRIAPEETIVVTLMALKKTPDGDVAKITYEMPSKIEWSYADNKSELRDKIKVTDVSYERGQVYNDVIFNGILLNETDSDINNLSIGVVLKNKGKIVGSFVNHLSSYSVGDKHPITLTSELFAPEFDSYDIYIFNID